MAKRTRKKATKQKQRLKRPGKDQKALVARLDTIRNRLLPPGVQAIAPQAKSKGELPVLHAPQRQALIHTIALVARTKSIDQVGRYILDTVPPVPLFLMLQFFATVRGHLVRVPLSPEYLDSAADFSDHELLLDWLQSFERQTRPEPPPPPDPPDDFPGPIAQSAFAA